MEIKWQSIGFIIALVVLVVTIVLIVVNQIPLREGLLIAGLALARLLP